MRRVLAALLALFAWPASAAPPPNPVDVTVTRTGETFAAEFTFPYASAAWGFFRSSPAATDQKSWRLQSWQVLTPGVSLQRRGKFDAFVGSDGRPVPRKVRVRVAPFTGHLAADYVPALRLGGNSVALFDGHFATFSVDSAARLDSLPVTFDRNLIGDSGTLLRFRGDNLRLAGDVDGYRTGNSEGTYGLFGVPRATREQWCRDGGRQRNAAVDRRRSYGLRAARLRIAVRPVGPIRHHRADLSRGLGRQCARRRKLQWRHAQGSRPDAVRGQVGLEAAPGPHRPRALVHCP